MKLIKSVKSGQLATIKAQWYELTHKKSVFRILLYSTWPGKDAVYCSYNHTLPI